MNYHSKIEEIHTLRPTTKALFEAVSIFNFYYLKNNILKNVSDKILKVFG